MTQNYELTDKYDKLHFGENYKSYKKYMENLDQLYQTTDEEYDKKYIKNLESGMYDLGFKVMVTRDYNPYSLKNIWRGLKEKIYYTSKDCCYKCRIMFKRFIRI